MFQITIVNLILVYISLIIGVVGLVWLVGVVRRRLQLRAERQEGFCCRVCGALYRESGGAKVVDCPQCGRPNERGLPVELQALGLNLRFVGEDVREVDGEAGPDTDKGNHP